MDNPYLSLKKLQDKLSYSFKDPNLLVEALTHKSFVNENQDKGLKDNERLEFLGDAVLDLSISAYLIRQFPQAREGELSKLKAIIVSEPILSRIATDLHIGEYLFLGKGEEKSGGRKKTSLLANAFEAVIGAIYMDGGFESARRVVEMTFAPYIDHIVTRKQSFDYKTDLQEYCQAHGHSLPVYKVVRETGPDHKKIFEVEIIIDGKPLGTGKGKSKKDAEQKAAKEALKVLTRKI